MFPFRYFFMYIYYANLLLIPTKAISPDPKSHAAPGIGAETISTLKTEDP